MLIGIGRMSQHPRAGFNGYNPAERGACIDFSDLTALVISIDLAEYTGSTGEANLSDAEWITPRAIHHDEVLSMLMDRGPVLPVSFGSVFSDPGLIAAMLEEHTEKINAFLDRVEGCVEIGVEVDAHLKHIQETRLARPLSPATTSGKDYLKQKRVATDRSAEARRHAVDIAKAAMAAQSHRFKEAVARPIRQDASGDPALERVASWAMLVPVEHAGDLIEALTQHAATLQHEGVLIKTSGPWPAYSFCPSLAQRNADEDAQAA